MKRSCTNRTLESSTYGGEGERVPLKEGHRGDVDEDVLSSLGEESLPPHLYLDGLGGMLHNLDHYHVAEASDEAYHPLNGVDDEATQDEGPGL